MEERTRKGIGYALLFYLVGLPFALRHYESEAVVNLVKATLPKYLHDGRIEQARVDSGLIAQKNLEKFSKNMEGLAGEKERLDSLVTDAINEGQSFKLRSFKSWAYLFE